MHAHMLRLGVRAWVRQPACIHVRVGVHASHPLNERTSGKTFPAASFTAGRVSDSDSISLRITSGRTFDDFGGNEGKMNGSEPLAVVLLARGCLNYCIRTEQTSLALLSIGFF